ncbi:MAG TPA: dynamin family protein [Gemmatimonadales bacterium]|nr:dynamin family protein [Gemmatimonadales bacterium]
MTEATVARLRDLAGKASAADLVAEAGALEERVRAQRFHVACVGQFKRGKSTLINALLGRSLLPTGVIPVTSIPTVVRHGEPAARVRGREGWKVVPVESLADYVTEQRNPGNAKQIQLVEVTAPAEILEGGLCLVDTPGLGSIWESNATATREFVPQVDAALVVLGADPPLSGEELHLIEAISADVQDLIFVMNKADRVSPGELDEASAFIRETLNSRLGLGVDRLIRVTAVNPASAEWVDLVSRLRSLTQERREDLVRQALRRGIARIGANLTRGLQERRAALVRPVDQAERRVDELRRLGESTDQALRELSPLLGAEEQRLCARFTELAERFLEQAGPTGLARLRAAWASGRFDHASRRESLEFANESARDLIFPWLHRSEREAEGLYREAVGHFSRLANDQVARLTAAADLGHQAIPLIVPEAADFRIGRHFAFNDRLGFHYPRSPWPGLIDRLVSRRLRQQRRQRRAEAYLMDLLTVNSSRVAGDLSERVRESRREVEAEVREALRRVSQSAAGALEWARAIRARGADEIDRQVQQLDQLLGELRRLLEPLGDRAAA